jgi:hypothetical protein
VRTANRAAGVPSALLFRERLAPVTGRPLEGGMTRDATAPDLIAGWKNSSDWQRDSAALSNSGSPEAWRKIFEEYFLTRLELRYLAPIRVLQDCGTFQGEGFSIAAIQCSLIEFLESTIQGISYRYLHRGETLGPYEYSSSSAIFRAFLTTRRPFAAEFDEQLAESFYVGVRCALLHEACTRDGWRIHAEHPTRAGQIVSASEKVLFRNGFQRALLEFIEQYGAALTTSRDMQGAFVRKFNSLCS